MFVKYNSFYKPTSKETPEGVSFLESLFVDTPFFTSQKDQEVTNKEMPVAEEKIETPEITDQEVTNKEMPVTEEKIETPEITDQEVFKDKKEFINRFKPIYEKVLSENGISLDFVKPLLAQIGLESAWGSKPSGKYNYGGIKATKNDKSKKAVTTHEFVNGSMLLIPADSAAAQYFANYDSHEDFVRKHVGLFTSLPRYKKVFTDSADNFAINVREAGYATDPAYTTKLLKALSKFQKGGKVNDNKIAYKKSLQQFIRKYPRINGVNTAEFADFFTNLVGIESDYTKEAIGKKKDGTLSGYNGWYALEIPQQYLQNAEYQHRKAYEHLAYSLKHKMVKGDIDKARQKNILPEELLGKIWNQGSRVTNYLYNGKDEMDGNKVKVSDYGNGKFSNKLDYRRYLPDGIYGDYYQVKSGDAYSNITERVRTFGRDYGVAGRDLLAVNPKLNPEVIKSGQIIRIRPYTPTERFLGLDEFNPVTNVIKIPYRR